MRDLGPLGGWSEAYGINDAGQVVGISGAARSYGHPFITGPDGMGMRDLGTLGGERSQAFSINDAGQVVGWAGTVERGTTHAFITGPDGEGMTDLNSLIDLPQEVILTGAIDINNNGQIIAIVPEPETYCPLLAGLGLSAFVARRKNAENMG